MKAMNEHIKWMAADDSKLSIAATKGMLKMWDEERPHTLCHGDFNAGNVWKPKSDGKQTGFLFADWHIMGINVVTYDFLTVCSSPS